MSLQTWNLLVLAPCFTFSKTMNLWSRLSSKAEVQQWDTCPNPQSCAWLVIWQDQLGPEDPNQIRWHQKTNSQTYWQKAISHVMSGTIFSVCSILAFSALPAALKQCRKENRKEQEKKELWQSQDRRWTWFRRLHQAFQQRRVRVHRTAPGYSKAFCQCLSLKACVVRPAAEDSNQNDAASSSQVWQSDAKTNASAERLAATLTYQNLDYQASAGRPAVEGSSGIVNSDSVWPTRINDRKMIANQETAWTISMWIRWYCERSCLQRWMQHFILDRIIWRSYFLPRISHIEQ